MRSIPLAFLPARQILHPLGYYPLARNASLDLTCCVVYFLSQNGILFFCGYASFARILTGYDRDSVLCLNDVMSFAPTRGSPSALCIVVQLTLGFRAQFSENYRSLCFCGEIFRTHRLLPLTR